MLLKNLFCINSLNGFTKNSLDDPEKKPPVYVSVVGILFFGKDMALHSNF